MSSRDKLIAGVIAAVVVFALTGCNPHKKLQRLIKKHPELVEAEVIYVKTPPDTVIKEVVIRDTVKVENERLKVEIRRIPVGSICDTAAIHAEVYAECKEVTVPVIHEKLVPCEPGLIKSWWRTVAIVLGAWLVLTQVLPRVLSALNPLKLP